MKKVRVLLLVMTLALIMSGVGYAAWSDSLYISSIIRTGELNVSFVEDNSHLKVRGAEYVEPSLDINKESKGHTAEVSLNNMYPGAWAMFKVKGANLGTIPAKFQSVKANFQGDTELIPYLTFESGVSIDINGDNQIDKTAYFKGDLQNFEALFNDTIEKQLKDVIMEPKSSGSFLLGVPYDKAGDIEKKGLKDDYIIIRLKEDAPQELQGKSLKFNLDINFEQYNK